MMGAAWRRAPKPYQRRARVEAPVVFDDHLALASATRSSRDLQQIRAELALKLLGGDVLSRSEQISVFFVESEAAMCSRRP